MAYAELDALKRYLRIDETDTLDDEELTRALDVASAEVDHLCSRSFELVGEEPSLRVFLPYRAAAGRGMPRWWVPIDHIPNADALVGVYLWNDGDVDYSTPVTGATLQPYSPGPGGYTDLLLPADTAYSGTGWWDDELQDSSSFVAVEALWGWEAYPPGVVQATIIQATRLVKRRESPFGMINSLDGSEQARLTRTLDPDVVVALRGLIKYWAAR